MTDSSPPDERTQVILWAAFCMTPLIFAGVGWTMHPGQMDDPTTVYVIASMAAPMTLAAFFVPRLLGARGGARYTSTIVGFALAEAISIFGLVVMVLGGPKPLGLGVIAWGFLLTLLKYPTSDPLERR